MIEHDPTRLCCDPTCECWTQYAARLKREQDEDGRDERG